MTPKISDYIALITKNRLKGADDLIGDKSDKLIYMIILNRVDKSAIVSRRLIKSIIHKISLINQLVGDKFRANYYDLNVETINEDFYRLTFNIREPKPAKV